MHRQLGARRILSLGSLALALLACSPGVPQAEVDSLNRQLRAEQMKVSALEELLSGREGVTVLLGAAPESSPAPAPAQAGASTPTAPPALPASFSAPVTVYIYADTIVGSGSQYGVGPVSDTATAAGVISGIFKRGMRIVFRFEAVDTSTGRRLAGADVESAIVRLPGGEELHAEFGRHGDAGDAPWLWTASWDIPPDYPLGTLDWRVEVKTRDGKTGSFRQFQAYSLERGSESRTQIVE